MTRQRLQETNGNVQLFFYEPGSHLTDIFVKVLTTRRNPKNLSQDSVPVLFSDFRVYL